MSTAPTERDMVALPFARPEANGADHGVKPYAQYDKTS
jgi:hypothetical protein